METQRSLAVYAAADAEMTFRSVDLLHFQHSVPHADVGLNVLRRMWLLLNFLAQRGHKHPQGGDIVVPAAAPDILSDKGVGQHLADVFG